MNAMQGKARLKISREEYAYNRRTFADLPTPQGDLNLRLLFIYGPWYEYIQYKFAKLSTESNSCCGLAVRRLAPVPVEPGSILPWIVVGLVKNKISNSSGKYLLIGTTLFYTIGQ